VLETFDRNVAAARAAVAGASDEHLRAGWTLISNGRPVFTQPRTNVLGNGEFVPAMSDALCNSLPTLRELQTPKSVTASIVARNRL